VSPFSIIAICASLSVRLSGSARRAWVKTCQQIIASSMRHNKWLNNCLAVAAARFDERGLSYHVHQTVGRTFSVIEKGRNN
jgi:hypothetical protein